MKIAIINDIHYGVRGDSNVFLNHIKKFLDTSFFPYLEKNNIKTIFIPGDLVDRRKFINFNTLKRMREDFLEKLLPYDVHISAGNHDVSLKNTNEVNALTELLREGEYNNCKLYINPEEIQLGNIKVLVLPWICQENYDKTLDMIKNTDAEICFGHLELEGFEMHLGTFCNDGLDPKLFSKFHSVFTGHFHHKSSRMNIHYTGAPYQMTWSDYDDPRGFHVFDTETYELEYIQNPHEMFIKIVYSDKGKQLDDVMNMDFEAFKDSYVKILVNSKENPYWFDLFLDEIEKKAIDVKIQDIEEYNLEESNGLDVIQDMDVKNLLNKFVSQGKYKCDKNKLLNILISLYNDAQNLEV